MTSFPSIQSFASFEENFLILFPVRPRRRVLNFLRLFWTSFFENRVHNYVCPNITQFFFLFFLLSLHKQNFNKTRLILRRNVTGTQRLHFDQKHCFNSRCPNVIFNNTFTFPTSQWFCENAADRYRCILNVTCFVLHPFRFVIIFASLCFVRYFSYFTFFAIIVTNKCWIYDVIISIKTDLLSCESVSSKCVLYYYPARLSTISLQTVSAFLQSHLFLSSFLSFF